MAAASTPAPLQPQHGPRGQEQPPAQGGVSGNKWAPQHCPNTPEPGHPQCSQDGAGAYTVLPSVQVLNVSFIHYF